MSAAHLILGLTALGHGDMSAARAYEESAVALAAQTGQAWVSAQTQLCLSIVCAVQGDIDRATSLLAGCLDHLRALGDERGTALARLHMGILALRRGDDAEARAPLEDALELFTAVQDLAGTAESRMQRVTLPAMDVLSSDVGRLSLELSPGKTTFEAGTHQPVEQPQTTSRSWPLSKFTFKLGTLDPRSVLGIKSFTVETLVGKPPAFPNLVLTLDESTGGGWQTWFDSFLAGHTGAGNELSGTITLLDSTGAPLMLQAELYVEQMDIAPGL
jgi:hypothetical protein